MEVPTTNINHRYVKVPRDAYTSDALGFSLFLITAYWYKKRIYVHDKNFFNWALFNVASLFASHFWAKTLTENSLSTAARVNNNREIDHQRAIGHYRF